MKRTLISAVLVVAASSGTAVAAPTYSVIDLGTLGGASSQAYGINNVGQIVGWSDMDIASHTHRNAFLYSRSSGITDLGSSVGIDINDSGQVVVNNFGAKLYSNGTMTDLGNLGGGSSFAGGINNSGQVVGASAMPPRTIDGITYFEYYEHAFLYSDGRMSDLGTLGGDWSNATDINDSSQVVGHASTDGVTGASAIHAFLYSGGSMLDLGTLGGNNSHAWGINNAGQIVGSSQLAASADNSAVHAFLYSNGVMTDLGTLGGNTSFALSVNKHGVVVGNADTTDGSLHAFLYNSDGIFDLNNLIDPATGWVIEQSFDINDSGQIAAYGCSALGCHALLLTPVPEPKTYLMMLVGLALLGQVAWRRR